jgi:3-oxoadipate enol-lactonase
MAAFTSFDSSVKISTVELSAVQMRVARIGQGPDIVWIPGGDSPAEAWQKQMLYFSDRFRSTSYDPRGIGETLSTPAPWTIGEFARDCAELIEQVCKPPVVVAGLSMGALITQQIAIDYPELVRVAIPMGTAAYIDGFTRDWMQAEIDLRKDGVQLPDYFLAPHYAAYALPASSLGDADTWASVKLAYTERFANRDPQDLIDQWQACLELDCREALKTCPVPIHAIAFSEDLQTPPSMVRVVADCAMHGTYHEIPGLGHVSLSRDQAPVVNEKLAQILSFVE